jgi:hypothetical protein
VRVIAAIALLALVPLAGTRAAPAAQDPPGLYLVRPDLRLCPSPLCGGAWVRRVNRTETRCAGGASRRECSVASISGVAVPAQAGSLVRGRIVPAGIAGFPELGRLAATSAWRAASPGTPAGTVYRVADNGARCVTHPCFALAAVVAGTSRRVTLSGIDLSATGTPPALERRIRALLARGGLYLAGTIRVVPDEGPAGDGRTLVATAFWLPA